MDPELTSSRLEVFFLVSVAGLLILEADGDSGR